MSTSGAVQCTFVILQEDFDIQTAFVAGEKVAMELKIPCQGTNIYPLVISQGIKFLPTLAFQIDVLRIDELTKKLADELKVPTTLLRALVFRPQPVESGRPPPEGMIR